MASLHDRLQPASQEALALLVGAYDQFISNLDDRFYRSALVKGGHGSADMRAGVEETGRVIHDALLTLFHDDPLFREATRKYLMF